MAISQESSIERPTEVLRAQEWLEQHEKELIEDTRAILRIPSVEGEASPNAPFGKDVRRALDFVLELGNKWGMRTRDVEGYAGHAEWGEEKPVVMGIGHLDVVPVGSGWKHEPFGAEIDGGYIYARGAADDKGPTMAAFYALRALKETNAHVPARLRMVFGCDEESGFLCVKRYFEVEEPPTLGFAPDADWPLIHAEKGIVNITLEIPKPKGSLSLISLSGGSRPNVVPDYAEMELELSRELMKEALEKISDYWDKNVSVKVEGSRVIAKAVGKAAHGSMPFSGDSALTRLLRFALELAPPEQQKEYSNLLYLTHPSGVGLGIHGRDAVSEDLTTNIGIVTNEGDRLRIVANVRYPVTWSGEQLKEKCERFLHENFPEAKIVAFDDNPPLYFPLEKEPVKTICDVVRLETGEDKAPGVMGGGTYARAVPNTVSVGAGWEGDGPAHEHDERIKIEHLLKMAKIYCHIFYALAHRAAK
ncbi:MAG TPA: Sapep family Mn(2+)-dependent dipeptidase [Fimbriimonadales bacterium]|nr:Sapep family Mn(2+)-dependent dipeptidase [Fimbriimonadales bacterium]